MLNQLVKEWAMCGLNKGDVVLLHSNVFHTYKTYKKKGFKISIDIILESFLNVIGDSGTLVLPLFNFDFTNGVPFDIRKTKSHMGALTEAARLHPDAVRTGHPIYSFAAIGKDSDKFSGVDNYSGYGVDSPFSILRELDGKIASLNLPDQNSMTFYHHVEEMNNVDYRYHKTFISNYTGNDGITEKKEYSLFVRDLDKGVMTYVNPIGEMLWQNGLYKGCRHNQGSRLRSISANEMYNFVSKIILSGQAENNLYRIKGKKYE